MTLWKHSITNGLTFNCLIRSTDSGACHICGELGHKRRDCPTRLSEPPPKEVPSLLAVLIPMFPVQLVPTCIVNFVRACPLTVSLPRTRSCPTNVRGRNVCLKSYQTRGYYGWPELSSFFTVLWNWRDLELRLRQRANVRFWLKSSQNRK